MAGFSHFVQSFARSVGEVIFDLDTDERRADATDGGGEAPVAVEGPLRTYNLLGRLAVGDVADVYRAAAAELQCVVKVSRVPEGCAVLDHERKVLASLLARADGTTYRKYLPVLMESFPVADASPKRVTAFRHEPGFYTLEQVHEQHPALDGRHLAWIFNRLLTVLGFSHRQGIVHGAILPCHVLIHAADHGLQLVGWGQSVEKGRRIAHISTRYRDWYPLEVMNKQPASPATDLFMAARCLIYLAGGGPACDRMPDAVPVAMRRFVEACLLEGTAMRPNDAWQLMDEFNGLLRRLYGPPTFHPLTMT